MAAWTTLVLSRQSMQLTLKMPSCLQMTPAWSTLPAEHRRLLTITTVTEINNKLLRLIPTPWHLPSPLHVRDDVGDGVCQYLNVLKLHTSAATQNKDNKDRSGDKADKYSSFFFAFITSVRGSQMKHMSVWGCCRAGLASDTSRRLSSRVRSDPLS